MPQPSWSCDDGHHTIVTSSGATWTRASLDHVDGIATVLGHAERQYFGLTHLSDEGLRARLQRSFHPPRANEEAFVITTEDQIRGWGHLREWFGGLTIGSEVALPQPPQTLPAVDLALFVELGHHHLGHRSVWLGIYDHPDRDALAQLLAPAYEAGFVDKPSVSRRPAKRLDGRRRAMRRLVHEAPPSPRGCPRRM